jgi:hypothetical protein
MKRLQTIIFAIAVTLMPLMAGETVFGINDYSLGTLENPYSYAGLGRGYEIGALDTLRLNFMNYSAWTTVPHPTYGIRLGYVGASSESNTGHSYYNDYANFQGGFLGIPILKKKLVVGLGIQPFTNVEQNYKKQEENMDKYVLIKGGTSKAIFNISYTVKPFLRLGVGYEYNFGEVNRTFRMEFAGSANPLDFKYHYRFYGNSMVLSANLIPLPKLGVGFVFRPKFTGRIRIQPETNSTVINKSQLKKVTLPAFYGAGFQYNLGERTSVGMDFVYQNWKDEYSIEGRTFPDLFTNYFRISGGIEKRQSHKLFTSFAEKLDYRAGIFYGKQNYLSLSNNVFEYGVSFGLSLPITRFKSRLDFSGLIGRRGSLSDNQYKETFFMFGFTINASELWFVKLEK